MTDSSQKIIYRDGELENLLRVRDKFVDLIGRYGEQHADLDRGKLLGTIFDTVFFIGICNLREHMPSMKEVYLNTNDSRNRSLRNLELLETMNVIERITDVTDTRVKRVRLADCFRADFEIFVEQWIDSRKTVFENVV
ncbi:MAG: hypothetical protein QNJ85_20515 [Gammaproteobacteria bacterium]|nr:hypothetical protein [Gammaproteobacteria bacterium]